MGPLRFGALVLAYNQEQYISYSLRALAPHVEHIVVLFSAHPWVAYNARAREMFRVADGTRDILTSLSRQLPHLTIVEGQWEREEDMRNDGLRVLRRAGVDVCLSIDADEFYPEGGLERLKAEISSRNAPGTRYYVPYRTCFKRFDHLLETRFQRENGQVDSFMRAAVAVHLDAGTRFYRWRHTTGAPIDLPPTFFFWNMGYVLSDDRMWEKVHSWAHAFQLLPGWFEDKWLRWTPATRDLFYRDPACRWPRTIKINPVTLPRVLHAHPCFPDGRRDRATQACDPQMTVSWQE